MSFIRSTVLRHQKKRLIKEIGKLYTSENWRGRVLSSTERYISPEFADEILRFKLRHQKTYDSILKNLLEWIALPEGATLIKQVIGHFDYALELGWKYDRSALMLIRDSLGGHSGLTTVHERALIRLEDSTWFKEYTVTGGRSQRAVEYAPCIVDFVMQHPERVEEVIAVAGNRDITHTGQLIALLDGETTPIISDGAL